MRLFLFCLSAAIGCALLPFTQAAAQASSIFEGQDAFIETSVLLAPITPAENAFVSFGNAVSIQSLASHPAIFPQENDKVSWGNAGATLHSIPRDPFSGPPVNFEELLAERFKPILYLHQEERFRPQEIQVVLDTADLYKDNDLVIPQPEPLTKEFLSGKTESDYKLDLEGDVFIPGPEDNPYENTAYSHITRDQNRVVLQYWFFYYFNDWQGAPLGFDFTHEGDWEFIQLIFPENKTAEQIVDENIPPDDAVYSAHLGGYKAPWLNVEKDFGRPVVYVTQGSHANHFQKGVCDVSPNIMEGQFLGFGVDKSQQSTTLSSIQNKLIVDNIFEGNEWLLFGGLWGTDDPLIGGKSPAGPLQQTERWETPITWANDQIRIFEWNLFYQDHCDRDFDGIWNNADPDKENFSNDFAAPGPFGTETKGTITERGDREFKIRDSDTGGVYIQINDGNQTAIVQKDCSPRSTIVARPGKSVRVIATCHSAEFVVEEGSADFITVVDGIEVVATLEAGQSLIYDIVDDKLHVETSGEGEIPLTVNGEATIVHAGEAFFVRELEIDIKPGSARNSVNCKNRATEVIPAAILTTGDFDATTVDHSTVVFEGASEMHAKRHPKDVDGDGDTDLMFHFRLGDTTLTCASTQATLTGRTFSGDLFIGTNSIDTKTN